MEVTLTPTFQSLLLFALLKVSPESFLLKIKLILNSCVQNSPKLYYFQRVRNEIKWLIVDDGVCIKFWCLHALSLKNEFNSPTKKLIKIYIGK